MGRLIGPTPAEGLRPAGGTTTTLRRCSAQGFSFLTTYSFTKAYPYDATSNRPSSLGVAGRFRPSGGFHARLGSYRLGRQALNLFR